MELSANVALLVIDVQDAINLPRAARRNNPQADENIARLLAAWRDSGRPIIHVKDNARATTSPFHVTHPGNAIQSFARPQPGESLIEKETHSAFIGTDLEARLRSAGITTLVIVGFVTNHCVEATARMAGDLDFDAFVVSDATAAFDCTGQDGEEFTAELVHAVSLANIHGEFATVVDTSSVLASLDALARA